MDNTEFRCNVSPWLAIVKLLGRGTEHKYAAAVPTRKQRAKHVDTRRNLAAPFGSDELGIAPGRIKALFRAQFAMATPRGHRASAEKQGSVIEASEEE